MLINSFLLLSSYCGTNNKRLFELEIPATETKLREDQSFVHLIKFSACIFVYAMFRRSRTCNRESPMYQTTYKHPKCSTA